MDSVAVGFLKEAGVASMLGRVAKRVITPKNLGRAALVGAGGTAGVMAQRRLQKQAPMPPGALAREKRRSEIARFGTL